jgi:hypothetical protein
LGKLSNQERQAMKRMAIRPSKTVAASEQALALARGARDAFGLTTADLEALANFKGDVTTGPSHALQAPASSPRKLRPEK